MNASKLSFFYYRFSVCWEIQGDASHLIFAPLWTRGKKQQNDQKMSLKEVLLSNTLFLHNITYCIVSWEPWSQSLISSIQSQPPWMILIDTSLYLIQYLNYWGLGR